MKNTKNKAFTLAEVLVTLGVIGVVSAMTMPVLIGKYQEKQTVVRLKKAYTLVSQAYLRIVNDDGGILSLENRDPLKLMENFGKYLKYTKVCGYEKGCFPNVMYKSVKGGDYTIWEDKEKRTRAILADGTAIMYNVDSGDNNFTDEGIIGQIYVDINGFRGPNQLGKDFFYFYISRNNIFPGGDVRMDRIIGFEDEYQFKNGCLIGGGYACGAWVIFNENMDYLHCSDLSFNGKTKCK